MKLVFKRNDEDAYCRANCRGKQKGNERNCSDDPRIVERGARTRLLRSASFHVLIGMRNLSQIENSGKPKSVPFGQVSLETTFGS